MAKLSPALDRIPPQAIDAEQAVLGCLMLDGDPASVAKAREMLTISDFYREAHRAIFRALCLLDQAGQPRDVVTVGNRLEADGALDVAGGRAYLRACLDMVPSAARLPHYARLVREAATLRWVIDECGRRIGDAYEGVPADELQARLAEMSTSARLLGDGEYRGPKLRTVTFAELMQTEFDPLRWAVQGLIPEGLTVWVGGSKLGKSFAIYEIAYAVATGGMALSRIPVEKGAVLYLALEDPERRLKERGVAFCEEGQPIPHNLHLATHAPTLDEGLLAALGDFVAAHPDTRLIIVDTFARVRDESRGNEGVYWNENRIVSRFQEFGHAHRVAVVLLHHTNKMNPKDLADPYNAISGSTGIQAPADSMILFHRVRGEDTAKLYVIGREFQHATLLIQWADRGGWILVGDAEEHFASQLQISVLSTLAQAGKPLAPAEIAGRTGEKRKSVGVILQRLRQRGMVIAEGNGWYRPTENGLRMIASVSAVSAVSGDFSVSVSGSPNGGRAAVLADDPFTSGNGETAETAETETTAETEGDERWR